MEIHEEVRSEHGYHVPRYQIGQRTLNTSACGWLHDEEGQIEERKNIDLC